MLHKTAFYIFIAIIFSTFHVCYQTIEELASRLSLEETIANAVENSHKAIDSRKEVAKALKQKWETTAQGLPQINADANYNYNIKQPVTLVPAEFMGGGANEFIPLTFGTKQSATANITLTQLIFDGSYLVGLQAAKVFLDYTSNNAQKAARSEEHTSELQSRGHLVCRLLLD